MHAHSIASSEPPPANGTLTGVQLLPTEAYLLTLLIIFIAEINAHTTGAGNEAAVQCEIRYAGPGAKLSRLEIGFGELPCTGGLPFRISLIGRRPWRLNMYCRHAASMKLRPRQLDG